MNEFCEHVHVWHFLKLMSGRYKGKREKPVEGEEEAAPAEEKKGDQTFEEPAATEDTEIPEGINDLMNLPIELIRAELKRLGYNAAMVDAMPQWYLVATLRKRDRGPDGISGQIFSDTPEKELENIRRETEKKAQQEAPKVEKEEEEEDISDDSDWEAIMAEEKNYEAVSSRNQGLSRNYGAIESIIPQQVIAKLPQDVIDTVNKKIADKVPVQEILSADVFPIIFKDDTEK